MVPIYRTMARRMQAVIARMHIRAWQCHRSERGSATAEYAIAALAAAAFAGVLIAVVTSPEIRKLLTAIITKALKTK
ncbi:MAG: DUF4244 domain-containing protein [Bowdeniella nasicola]|nr:DUF4244 domain-containing protein [Bowdeniella nasicola]